MSLTRQLISGGFADLEKSTRFLEAPELGCLDRERLLAGLTQAADPDLALQSLVRLLASRPQLRSLLEQPEAATLPLFRLLGASEALAEFLMRRPEHLDVLTVRPDPEPEGVPAVRLRAALLTAVGADPDARAPVADRTGPDAWVALRVAYRRLLTELAIRDVCALDPLALLPVVGAELADLASAALDAALAVSRAEAAAAFDPGDVAAVRLCVLAMGKCGARELNYVSDVDVVHVVGTSSPPPDVTGEPDGAGPELPEETMVAIGTALAAGIARVISATAPEPPLWEVDTNLRPEGREGPLVRTLASHIAYYQRWAQNWEFQALLKARPAAGDLELGDEYLAALGPMVWSSSEREGFVESVQGMRRRVSENIPARDRERQIKLGAGGLRDVEFSVQLLQLVHGKVDESVRVPTTTAAIDALAAAGYIGRADAREMGHHYRFLRLLEHRIQLVRLRRTHLMPESMQARRALAKAVLEPNEPARPAPEDLLREWARAKRDVRALHERIFYRPLLNTAAHLSADDVRLSPEAAQARLAALGYGDPRGAMRHIEALTAGVSRRAALQRQLLPVLLGWFADGVDPDAGLLGFRRVSEALGTSPWYLGLLRDSSSAAERLCHVLSSSRLITDLLEVEPEAVAWLGNDDELRPVPFAAQWAEIRSKLSRHTGADARMRLVRLIRRREILRTAIADASGLLDQAAVGRALADADQAAVLGALHVAEREMFGDSPDRRDVPTDVLVVGMGRQGGREIGYGSDMDVLYVHDPRPGAEPAEARRAAEALVARISTLLQQRCTPPVLAERPLTLDAALRPEGRQGPIVRTLSSYREYYQRWADTWEAQALLRARPLAGDDALAGRFIELIDPVRYPERLDPAAVREVRRIKARVEAERLPRGADPSRHVKLGRGGLSDVEWLVQLLQLQHASTVAGLRTTSTLAALHAAAEAGLVPGQDAAVLEASWLLASRVRCGTIVWTGRSSDVLPSDRRALEAVARWCGYPAGSAARLEEDYLRLTRRARAIFERRFYGT
ncbi:bifunctional glutamine-synthetase adenylyltransferase/deadenyltransferase [Tersicoccus phoenicis]|uniref:Bifunctional glutamine-synthetase adenylyltransferase/deadenyltransferase n=1 Tax=Tersicoccus phoenicis TaxID=554083 RepID=A0A1R1LJW5_9MICC|nr:bifunctional [glutamine synthetase] adenylyltransferase/[glutamine synthetase]-adenylyl-L-tyrosine phosphorylase [Tersicoccus phoenicis]OMH27828.1 bifunctional glutamine-synthetase adenylyltransferase/deadenyltransferase [Tersicoccus phoenicis]